MVEVMSTNPATGEQRSLGFEEDGPAEVVAATEIAASALDNYANRPLTWRAGMLRAMAEELENDAANLVALASTETALPAQRLDPLARLGAGGVRVHGAQRRPAQQVGHAIGLGAAQLGSQSRQ